MKKPHFLQSPAWARFQRALGNEVINKQSNGSLAWAYLAIVQKGRFSRRLFCPYGPTLIAKDSADAKRQLCHALKDIKAEAAKLRLDFVRIEPMIVVPQSKLDSGEVLLQPPLDSGKVLLQPKLDSGEVLLQPPLDSGEVLLSGTDLKELGLRRAAHSVEPEHTVINDVTSLQAIDSVLDKKKRYAIRKLANDGVSYKVSYDPNQIEHFLSMLHEVAERTGIRPLGDRHFRVMAETLFGNKDAGLYFAMLNEIPIASAIFFNDGETMSYAHGAASEKYKELGASFGMLHSLMNYACELGCSNFDFFGVAPEGAAKSHPWAGFTAFKMKFGGKRVAHLGTWELPVNKLRYAAIDTIVRLKERKHERYE
ncbi:MAG: peptidoglycan bridge formation glycyltransferase FemA/FemB family protein [Coriobacteriales bacterium]|jgi:lipid II:glycine glycyltransferase (peptidoglycan interpeptide bridge formation enzyme)|nr:peptidoglycan bridge formation glycyltransferase FemA/FemB family protein [Coriobacteriales bacterium]